MRPADKCKILNQRTGMNRLSAIKTASRCRRGIASTFAISILAGLVGACGSGASNLSSRGGIWAQSVAGIKIGQDCRSAHRRFASSKWTYSSSYVNPPPDRTQADGTYTSEGENVSFGCSPSHSGMRVTSIQYNPSTALYDNQQLLRALEKKFGQPVGECPDDLKRTAYLWGDVRCPLQNGSAPSLHGPSVELFLAPQGGGALYVNAGPDWTREQEAIQQQGQDRVIKRQGSSL